MLVFQIIVVPLQPREDVILEIRNDFRNMN